MAEEAVNVDVTSMFRDAAAAQEAAEIMAPVLTAAEAGDAVAMAAALDAAGLQVDTPGEDGDTALHIGCLFGNVAVVQECLKRGANIQARDEDNSTPLHDACAGGHNVIAKLLLDGGADAKAADDDGDTPLHLASNGGHAHVVRLLCEHVADEATWAAMYGAANGNGQTPVDLAEDPALIAAMRIADEDATIGGVDAKRRRA